MKKAYIRKVVTMILLVIIVLSTTMISYGAKKAAMDTGRVETGIKPGAITVADAVTGATPLAELNQSKGVFSVVYQFMTGRYLVDQGGNSDTQFAEAGDYVGSVISNGNVYGVLFGLMIILVVVIIAAVRSSMRSSKRKHKG